MSVKLLINLRFSVSPEEYKQAVGPLARQLATVDGLRRTIFLMRPARRQRFPEKIRIVRS